MNKILEVSNRLSKGGRRRIALVLHKIHTDEKETNRNGLHWSEENTLRNIESVKGIPICAEFVDENKDIPVGHGYTGTVEIENRTIPVFENSEVCGSIDHGEIRTLEVNGEKIKALVGIGYLYEQRYPKFVQWVKNSMQTSNLDTSVEIVGLETNDGKIVYEDGECSEKYRCPKEYDYSGTAILSILPADSDAVVLEVAQLKDQKKGDQNSMSESEIMNIVKEAIADTDAVKAQYETTIGELNSAIAEKDQKIADLEANAAETTTAMADKDSEIEKLNAQISELNASIDTYKKEKKLAELNDALSAYSEEECKFAETEINAFKENPLEGDISAIKSVIAVAIVDKMKADEKIAEQNSAKEEENIESIFGDIEAVETGSEDVNIF